MMDHRSIERRRFWHWGTGLWGAVALTVMLAMPGFFTLPPLDRDEALFAQSSAQMLASGDFVDIRFGEEARYKKPVGIYWLQAAAGYLTGEAAQIWSYRLVSLLGAAIAVGFTHQIARLVAPPPVAFLAAVCLGASVLMGVEARLATTDAMLLASIVAAQYVLARAFLPAGKGQLPDLPLRLAMGFWLAISASILIKGPIGPMVVLLTLVGLCAVRRDLAILRALAPLRGLLLLAVLVLPWLMAITLRSDGDFWTASVGRDMLAKIAVGQESHGAWPGTYLGLLWFTFWPGSIILAAGLPAMWRARAEPVMVFGALWLVPGWVIFELTATKLTHYVLPMYPALALMAAYAYGRSGPGLRGLAALMLLPPIAVLAAIVFGAQAYQLNLTWYFWGVCAGLVAWLPALLLAYFRGEPQRLGFALALASFGLSAAIYPVLAANIRLWPAKQIAQIAAAHPGCALMIDGYNEPSIVFLSRNQVSFVSTKEAIAAADGDACKLIFVRASGSAEFAAVNPKARLAGRVDGVNLGKGTPVELQAYVSGAEPAP